MENDGRWLVREITEIVAATTQLRFRRASGEHVPWCEQLELQHRKIRVLEILAERGPRNREICDVLGELGRPSQRSTARGANPPARHRPDLGARP